MFIYLKLPHQRVIRWKPVFPDIDKPDKQNHFLAGLVLGAVVGAFVTPLMGAVVAVLCGALKEMADYFLEGHCCEVADFMATALGGICGALVVVR